MGKVKTPLLTSAPSIDPTAHHNLLPSFSYSTFPSAACLRSCTTCKQMYGGNFKGHSCAMGCIESRGSSWRPVCTDLPSIRSFLDLSSLASFRWSDEDS